MARNLNIKKIEPWLTIGIASLSFALSVVSLFFSWRGYVFSRDEFFAQRTVILSSSVRPFIDMKELQEQLDKNSPEGSQKAYELYRDGFKRAALVFVPNPKPSGIKDITIYFAHSIANSHSFQIKNISSGQALRFFRDRGVIDDGDFAVDFAFVYKRMSDFLRKITPERHKQGAGTLNEITLPVVIEVVMLLKGQRFTEYQLYHTEIGFQVASDGDVFVQSFTLDFERRLENRNDLPTALATEMLNVVPKFSEPLPPGTTAEEILKHVYGFKLP